MISLTYDASALTAWKDDLTIPTLGADLVRDTLFKCPVRFRVDEVDLFEIPEGRAAIITEALSLPEGTRGDGWLVLPLILFADTGLETAKKLWRSRETKYPYIVYKRVPSSKTEYLRLGRTRAHLRFSPVDEMVEVFSSINGYSVTVGKLELFDTFRDFIIRVRADLTREVPLLMEHGKWGYWLKIIEPERMEPELMSKPELIPPKVVVKSPAGGSINPNDLIPELNEWNEGQGVDIKDWINMLGSYQHAIAYSFLLWPDFVEFNDCVFLASKFDMDYVWDLLLERRGKPSDVETWVNEIDFGDNIFPNDKEATQEQVLYLARKLRDIWTYRLQHDFPERKFVVELDEPSLVLTFYQPRE
ncbi:MAG TPA: hypothetical protein PKW33_14460 [Anaerolineaceae bacterium]|nr:hypothetical protein [Anaerolineaceae bacterium]HPN52792.1 hypothetical protein [Anaerolineaceae bacterium]